VSHFGLDSGCIRARSYAPFGLPISRFCYALARPVAVHMLSLSLAVLLLLSLSLPSFC
jgi:hypothetical protein